MSVMLLILSGCALSVNDYLVEARTGDPESIQRAVVGVGHLLQDKEQQGIPFDSGDEEAVKYLTEVAEVGKDAVNRASAIDNLSRLHRPKLTNLYVKALEDKSWSVQLEAAKALARNPDPEAVPGLSRQLDADIRSEVRLEIVKTLASLGGEEALRQLLEAFLERSGRVSNIRLTVLDGIRKLSGKDFGPDDRERWQSYFAERFPTAQASQPPRSPFSVEEKQP